LDASHDDLPDAAVAVNWRLFRSSSAAGRRLA
jgi:hypothetical protein